MSTLPPIITIFCRYLCRVLWHKALIVAFGLLLAFKLRAVLFKTVVAIAECDSENEDSTMKKQKTLRYRFLRILQVPFGGARWALVLLWCTFLKRLILHDASKFSRAEFWPYAMHFFGRHQKQHPNDEDALTTAAFHKAVVHHVKHNDHHPEFWWGQEQQDEADSKVDGRVFPSTNVEKQRRGKTSSRAPLLALLEMVVDWHAAEVAYTGRIPLPNPKGGKLWPYAAATHDKTGLHPQSEVVFRCLLLSLGFKEEVGGSQRLVRDAKDVGLLLLSAAATGGGGYAGYVVDPQLFVASVIAAYQHKQC